MIGKRINLSDREGISFSFNIVKKRASINKILARFKVRIHPM